MSIDLVCARDENQEFEVCNNVKHVRTSLELTQEELAERIGAKKSYISRIENGKTDIQLSTLYKIFELGLRKRITISVT